MYVWLVPTVTLATAAVAHLRRYPEPIQSLNDRVMRLSAISVTAQSRPVQTSSSSHRLLSGHVTSVVTTCTRM